MTPWNKAGYGYTTLHSERLSHVAPVWYQVKLQGASVTLEGTDAIDQTWLSTLHPTTKVVPRFEVQFASRKEVEAVLFFPRDEVKDITDTIMKEVTFRGYDGIVLEVSYVAQMDNLVKQLSKALRDVNKELILVIPAHHKVHEVSPFSHRDLLKYEPQVDYFSLNAYDHGAALGENIGNAPLPWLRQILDELIGSVDKAGTTTAEFEAYDDDGDPFEDDVFSDTSGGTSPGGTDTKAVLPWAGKVLLGLNFYGYTFTSDGVINTITATEYKGLLEFSQVSIPLTVEWHERVGEHGLDGKLWTIWYPTVLSLLHRVDLAAEYGIGLSIWEAGQGLDHFWDIVSV
ncbi:protein of unknown function [Taphrina deformans PYCC 5710]|uniref:Chitinase domain-containing protein 1 n=1 Tax=Taphrina deformans (strain PYCC 5710 / ATCC 11124 / CBS 356.35 / IMI 108563 / JCM 9778 / NBRC 8474) TaxID=1097556 RepID=R4XEB4_TAPDE|nr:protein of unknown function [Taphrina deformans PYCC 5710]|eukprot:CCG84162.1 protein of unknown function [Taphrina deformans PYCC 5710]